MPIMGIEIERKFLVIGSDWKSTPGTTYRQGYLSSVKERTVRIRVVDDAGWITVKGQNVGASRAEFEYPVPVEDARTMLELCEKPLIEKIRRKIPHAGLVWEVDEFLGENAGLVVAEIELSSPAQPFAKPAWVGQEVTDDPRYFNSALARTPYSRW